MKVYKYTLVLCIMIGCRVLASELAPTNGATLDRRIDELVELMGKAHAERNVAQFHSLQAEMRDLVEVRRYPRAIEQLEKARTERERFYALTEAAMEAMNAGKAEEAKRYAEELQQLMTKYPKDWNYGNAVQDVHLVLGRIALREGKVDEAKNHLLEAGKSPGSPQMNSFGPNMTLAKELLEHGEKEVVLQYFDLCAKFWKMDFGQLSKWKSQIEKGEVVSFIN